jgi:hypothetical protein
MFHTVHDVEDEHKTLLSSINSADNNLFNFRQQTTENMNFRVLSLYMMNFI